MFQNHVKIMTVVLNKNMISSHPERFIHHTVQLNEEKKTFKALYRPARRMQMLLFCGKTLEKGVVKIYEGVENGQTR